MARRRRRKRSGCLTQKCRDRKKWSSAMRAVTRKGGRWQRKSRKAARRGYETDGETYWYGDLNVASREAREARRGRRRPSARAAPARFAGCGCG